MPDGVIRALRDKRLPSSAQVWYPEKEAWVSLASYPAVLELLQTISAHRTVVSPSPMPGRKTAASPRPSAPLEYIELDPEPAAAGPQDASAQSSPNAGVVEPPVASTSSLAPTSAPSPETSPGKGIDSPRATSPAEGPSTSTPQSLPARRPSRARVPRAQSEKRMPPLSSSVDQSDAVRGRWLAGIVIFLAVGVIATLGWYLHERRRGPVAGAPAATVTAEADTPASRLPAVLGSARTVPVSPTPLASAVTVKSNSLPTLPLQGVPGAGPEPDLLVRLQLADALAWQASRDFSPEVVVLAVRKVDAIHNSIDAYRVDMRRLAAGAVSSSTDMARRIEPFDEASRIDEVVAVMKAAVLFVDSAQGRYRVRGEQLAFGRVEDAAHYNAFRARADSLLRAPVPMDRTPSLRPPRRIVTHLVATLPSGILDPERTGHTALHPVNP